MKVRIFWDDIEVAKLSNYGTNVIDVPPETAERWRKAVADFEAAQVEIFTTYREQRQTTHAQASE